MLMLLNPSLLLPNKKDIDPAQGVKVSTAMVAVTGVFAADVADAFYVANVNTPLK